MDCMHRICVNNGCQAKIPCTEWQGCRIEREQSLPFTLNDNAQSAEDGSGCRNTTITNLIVHNTKQMDEQ